MWENDSVMGWLDSFALYLALPAEGRHNAKLYKTPMHRIAINCGDIMEKRCRTGVIKSSYVTLNDYINVSIVQ